MATELDKIRGIIPLKMEVEMVSETSGFCPQLTWLVAQEDFINIKVVNKPLKKCSKVRVFQNDGNK
jgi:hypothetical protein